jgi:HEAT repeat protein
MVGTAVKTKLTILLFAFLCVVGCSKDSTYKNEYYEHAKMLAQKVSSNQDQAALTELLSESKSSDFWTRSYSVEYLAEILESKNVIDKNDIIDALVVALNDPRPEVQNPAIDGLINSGQDGVVKGFFRLRAFVLSHRDSSVSWNAADALGLISEPPAVNEAIKVLVQALQYRTENESVEGAPQLREQVFKSLGKISEKQPALVLSALEQVLPKLDGKYSQKASALVLKLQKRLNSQAMLDRSQIRMVVAFCKLHAEGHKV